MDPNNEVLREFPRLFRLYKDGTVQRFLGTDTTPPGTDPTTNVLSKDVTINPHTGLAARLYLPPNPAGKLPLLIYLHGGAFCIGSPFNPTYHRHINDVAAAANAVVVSVHYRLAPEHPLPVAYDDSWEAVQWAASHAGGAGPEPWLNDHADLDRAFFAGDSAGANLAHDVAMRGTEEGFKGLKLNGVVLVHPYFGSEQKDELIEFLYPTYGGAHDPKIHVEKDPRLSGLRCERVLVLVAEKDFIRDRGVSFHATLKSSGWNGKLDMVETQGQGHVFHLFAPTIPESLELLNRFATFIRQP